ALACCFACCFSAAPVEASPNARAERKAMTSEVPSQRRVGAAVKQRCNIWRSWGLFGREWQPADVLMELGRRPVHQTPGGGEGIGKEISPKCRRGPPCRSLPLRAG